MSKKRVTMVKSTLSGDNGFIQGDEQGFSEDVNATIINEESEIMSDTLAKTIETQSTINGEDLFDTTKQDTSNVLEQIDTLTQQPEQMWVPTKNTFISISESVGVEFTPAGPENVKNLIIELTDLIETNKTVILNTIDTFYAKNGKVGMMDIPFTLCGQVLDTISKRGFDTSNLDELMDNVLVQEFIKDTVHDIIPEDKMDMFTMMLGATDYSRIINIVKPSGDNNQTNNTKGSSTETESIKNLMGELNNLVETNKTVILSTIDHIYTKNGVIPSDEDLLTPIFTIIGRAMYILVDHGFGVSNFKSVEDNTMVHLLIKDLLMTIAPPYKMAMLFRAFENESDPRCIYLLSLIKVVTSKPNLPVHCKTAHYTVLSKLPLVAKPVNIQSQKAVTNIVQLPKTSPKEHLVSSGSLSAGIDKITARVGGFW